MDLWDVRESSTVIHDEPFITDIVDYFSNDNDLNKLLSNQLIMSNFSTQQPHSFSRVTQNIQFDLEECMSFHGKDVTITTIKQYNINQGYKFVVVDSKIDRYLERCINHHNNCIGDLECF